MSELGITGRRAVQNKASTCYFSSLKYKIKKTKKLFIEFLN